MNKLICIIFLIMFNSHLLTAKDIYIDYENGSRNNSGSRACPLSKFREGLKLAKPGDTIYILPAGKPIYAQIRIKNVNGEEKHPITVDGMMNTFIGKSPVDLNIWKEVKPGLYHKKAKISKGMRRRYAMFFNDKINRMGYHIKCPGGNRHKKVEDLKINEWTITGKENADFYFRIRKGKTPEEVKVEEPKLSSGINISGECNYITVKNMIVKNFLNDGINIHHNCRNINFENIASIYNTDDGISAHENCQITLKNFVSIGNSTGICHLNDVEAIHENIYIAPGIDCRELYMLNKFNKFKNLAIVGNAAAEIFFGNGENILKDCYIVLRKKKKGFIVNRPPLSENVLVTGEVDKELPDGFSNISIKEITPKIDKVKLFLQKIFNGNVVF